VEKSGLMTSTFQSREDAIVWLQARDFHAFKKDSNIGESIHVATDLIAEFSFRAFRYALHIHWQADQWCVTDFSQAIPETKNCGTLEQATLEATRALQEKLERDLEQVATLMRAQVPTWP
jgi:hypothetical protein